jgi:post-segregation antitoxin (ccd killing protein)
MKITITIPDNLGKKIRKYRKGVLEINISKICAKAIKEELEKLNKN